MSDDDHPDLFDFEKRRADARSARDDGMARVEEHAEPGWSDAMYHLVVEIVRTKQSFTSDDVFDLAALRGIAHGTHDRRAFGPVMMRAARDGLCEKANCAALPSRRASLHASPRAVWMSLWKEAVE